MWKRYVYDTFVTLKTELMTQVLECINFMDPQIQFTAEDSNTGGSMAFLDTLITSGPDNTFL